MWRCILAVIAGVIAGSMVIFLLEIIGHQIVPPPPGMDATDLESIKAAMSKMPLTAFIAILVAWAGGAFGGGLVAAAIAQRRKITCALVVGGLLQLSGVASMLVIPHPFWFWVASIILPVPSSWLGASIVRRNLSPAAGLRSRNFP